MTLYRRFSPFSFVVFLVLFHIICYFLLRLVLFYFIEPSITDRESILDALYIGLKFDGRYAVFTVLPLALAMLFPAMERRLCAPSSLVRPLFCLIQTCIFGVLLLIHIFDFGVYFYLQQRIDMSLLDFIENPAISALMIWQSYPVVWITLAFIALLFVYFKFWTFCLKKHSPTPIEKKVAWKNSHFLSVHFINEIVRVLRTPNKNPFSIATFIRVISCLFLFIVGYGQISSNFFPLRWSNAYLSTDKNVVLIALHPAQNMYDTMHVSEVVLPNLEKFITVFPNMACYLGLSEENINTQISSLAKEQRVDEGLLLNFTRQEKASHRDEPVNVVLLMMESLTTPRSSLPHGTWTKDGYHGKGSLPAELDIDATPFLAELMDKALYYPNFYANSRTTARGIFSTLTGIPDINVLGGTSSRNPRVIDQQIIFNEFDDYEKYYLIGGNANWANIRGVFQNNIEGLHLKEESDWKAPNVDVWGISDLALLRESVTLFNESKKPFVAFVQTAGFHRPYTIPSDNEDFPDVASPSAEALEYWGFENEAEFHSLRFADHALRQFFARAEKEPWFENTVFIIFGDHGTTKNSANMHKGYINGLLHWWHTPFFIYAPKFVQKGVNPALHSQGDIFPTVADIAGIEYKNTTLGREMLIEQEDGTFIPKEFSWDSKTNQYTYDKTKDHDNRVYIGLTEGAIYLVEDDYIYLGDMSEGAKGAKLFALSNDEGENLVNTLTEKAEEMQKKVEDFYHSAKYLLFNNKKRFYE